MSSSSWQKELVRHRSQGPDGGKGRREWNDDEYEIFLAAKREKSRPALQLRRKALIMLVAVICSLLIGSIFIALQRINNARHDGVKVRHEEFDDGTNRYIDDDDVDLPVIAGPPITKPNTEAPVLFGMQRINKEIKVRGVTREKWDNETVEFHNYVERIKKTEAPAFQSVPGSVGIVTSCNLSIMCLTNLVYMFEQLKVDVPIELWLLKTEVNQTLLDIVLSKWSSRLKVKYFDDIIDKYTEVFGPLDRIKAAPPFRLLSLFKSKERDCFCYFFLFCHACLCCLQITRSCLLLHLILRPSFGLTLTHSFYRMLKEFYNRIEKEPCFGMMFGHFTQRTRFGAF